jgi:hypothetical protein
MRTLRVRFPEFLRPAAFSSFVSARRPRLRCRRISLRLALALVAIAAMVVGWLVHGVRLQQEGIELVRRHGGMYYYDFEDLTLPQPQRSWAPRWLVKNLGIDYFHDVTWVRIEDPRFNDDNLRRLTACLPRIEAFGIAGTAVTDAGLTHLRGNRRLMAIFLERSLITDAGIDNLGPDVTPVLDALDVRGTCVSPAKVAAVEAIFDARESAARKAHSGMRISHHLVLSGYAPPLALGPNPRGEYEKSIAPKPTKP